MKSQILGDDMQALVLNFEKGEKVLSEAGAMMYKKGEIAIDAEMTGGLWGGIKRAIMSESLFLVTYNATGSDGELGLAPPYPGHIRSVQLNNSSIICQRDAFLCAHGDITTHIAFTKKLGFGFFGGEGFILQKISGTGEVFIHAGGNFVEKELGPEDTIDIDTGCVVSMDESIDYDIKSIGNIKTSLFAGEGIFVAHLKGPGKVLIQTLPFSRMAEKIVGAVNTTQGESRGVAGFGGNLVKNILSGN
jgi:uncharacterized protein (TIGR00266 family)